MLSLGAGLGATHDVIKNCNISTGMVTNGSSYGISVGGNTPGTAGADNDHVTLQNNVVTVASVGIYAIGTASLSAGGDDDLAITDNSIDYNYNGSYPVSSIGIRVGNALNSSVSRNAVSQQSMASVVAVAISVEQGFVSSSVTRNLVTLCTGGNGSRGITVGTGTAERTLTIANNVIYGVNGEWH